jgi:hypothetical protein
MILRRISILAVLLNAATPASAQAPMTQTECQSLARTLSGALRSFEDMHKNLAAIDYGPLITRAPNSEARGSFVKAAEANKAAAAAMRGFVVAMQDMNYQLQRCAR